MKSKEGISCLVGGGREGLSFFQKRRYLNNRNALEEMEVQRRQDNILGN